MTEKEKMIQGLMYNPLDKELCNDRDTARLLFQEINSIEESKKPFRDQRFYDLLPNVGKNLWIEPPFYCDYGYNIFAGENFFMNFNCCILDVAPVTIGNRVMFGPNVQIYTATHPLNAKERSSGEEFAKPITIGDDVWLGGGAIVCPGVTIGNGVVIGAGSIVTKDIPDNTFAAGNPAKVIKHIEQ